MTTLFYVVGMVTCAFIAACIITALCCALNDWMKWK